MLLTGSPRKSQDFRGWFEHFTGKWLNVQGRTANNKPIHLLSPVLWVRQKPFPLVLARDLFVALRRVGKEFNLSFPMTSVQQFAQRFSNDLTAIREAGFEITINELRSRGRTYDVRRAQ